MAPPWGSRTHWTPDVFTPGLFLKSVQHGFAPQESNVIWPWWAAKSKCQPYWNPTRLDPKRKKIVLNHPNRCSDWILAGNSSMFSIQKRFLFTTYTYMYIFLKHSKFTVLLWKNFFSNRMCTLRGLNWITLVWICI